MSNRQIRKEVVAKGKTTPPEWIAIAILVVIVIIAIIVIWVYYLPRLFVGSSVDVPQPPGGAPVCPVTSGPTGLFGTQTDLSEPNFDAFWDPVLTAATPGETVLGYNIYLSQSAGITEANKVLRSFTPVPGKRIAGLTVGTEYFFKVTTVDSCGEGPLSAEEASFTPS